jgi:hypothetical protein
MQSGFIALRQANIELQNEMSAVILAMERAFHIVNGNCQAGCAAACYSVKGSGSSSNRCCCCSYCCRGWQYFELALPSPALAVMTSPAILKSLYNVWNEYLNGVGRRKPESLFSGAERGKVKFKFSR